MIHLAALHDKGNPMTNMVLGSSGGLLMMMWISVSSVALAGPQPSPIWVESGMNLIWDSAATAPCTAPCPALTEGRGDIINALPVNNHYALVQGAGGLPVGQPYETFTPPPGLLLPPGGTSLDAGQFYCYVVLGNAVVQGDFFPTTWKFTCAAVPPDTDNSPSGALQILGNTPVGPLQGNTYFSTTWDAGYVGSIFTLDGGSAWQPWFRNGDGVLFDMPMQRPQFVAAQPNVPPTTFVTTLDPGFYLGSVSFTSTTSPAYQTVTLPKIFGTGYTVDVQVSNSDATGSAAFAFGTARVDIFGGGVPGTLGVPPLYIGEATVGPMPPAPLGAPRESTYHIDASRIRWTYANTSLTFDMTGHLPALHQVVAVGVVVHGYHDQLLK
jgi:hypothetical protein